MPIGYKTIPLVLGDLAFTIHYPTKDRLKTTLGVVDEIFNYKTYFTNFCCIEPGDVVVDCGAHIGLFTIYALLKGAKKVIAFEANPYTAEYFKENVKGVLEKLYEKPSVELHTFGVYDSIHTRNGDRLRFRFTKGSPGSKIVDDTEKDTAFVRVVTLDSMGLKGIDFLKMDIEGSEYRALIGGEQLIRRCRPKLSICLYHRPEDIFTITSFVHSLNLNYRFQVTDDYIDPKTGEGYLMGHWS